MITYKEYAKIAKSDSAEIRIFLSEYEGIVYANIRKYVDTANYSGPTQKGIALRKEQLIQLLNLLEDKKEDIKDITAEQDNKFVGKIDLSESISLVVRLLNNRFTRGKTCIDFRLRLSSTAYSGWTKKGVLIKMEDLFSLQGALKELASDLNKKSIEIDPIECNDLFVEILLENLKNTSGDS